MPFKANILKGIDFLLSHQNADKGIPATNPGEPSGGWTTSDVFEALLTLDSYPKNYVSKLDELLDFLINAQLDDGAWEIVVGSGSESTMATGHAVASISIYKKLFGSNNQIDRAIKIGLSWLRDNQNENGGWGVEPKASSSGIEFRMISTFYALRGFFESGHTSNNSRNVKAAVNFLLNNFDKQIGGWGGKLGSSPDPSNTARAIVCLIRSRHKNCENYVKKSIKYLLKKKSSWNIDIEAYVTSAAPGETVFNSNTPFDLMEAFYFLDYKGVEVYDLIEFFLSIQEDDGCWHLASQNKIEKNITTWSTGEAILALSYANKYYVPFVFQIWDKRIRPIWKYAFAFSTVLNFLLVLKILGVYEWIYTCWNSLSADIAEKILWGIIITAIISFVVGLTVNFLTPVLRKKFFKNKNE